jgi:hypothetical protein
MKNTLLPNILDEIKEKCKNIVKEHILYMIEDKNYDNYIWKNEYVYIDNFSEYENLIRLESENDFVVYIHPFLNNTFYFKVVLSNLIENIDFNDNSFKFDDFIYRENNQEIEKK